VASAGRDVSPFAQVEPGGITPALQRDLGENSVVRNSVVSSAEIQSFGSEIQSFSERKKTTEFPRPASDDDDDGDEWRFEIKRKKRTAGRKNTGSTARAGWYYWVIRVRRSDGATLYYGTLDVLDADDPQRLAKYWQRSAKRKVGKNA
jgi:hypothetical protein